MMRIALPLVITLAAPCAMACEDRLNQALAELEQASLISPMERDAAEGILRDAICVEPVQIEDIAISPSAGSAQNAAEKAEDEEEESFLGIKPAKPGSKGHERLKRKR